MNSSPQNLNLNGWKPDVPDQRDRRYSLSKQRVIGPYKALPKKVDLSTQMPAVGNQGSLGSCTAFAVCGAYDSIRYMGNGEDVEPSTLFQYYNTRVLEGTVNQDAGASIRNAVKVLVKTGVCDNSLWPYLISKFKVKPGPKPYKQAVPLSIEYRRLDNRDPLELQQCLAGSIPIIFGAALYEGHDQLNAKYQMKMPQKDAKLIGGHAMVLVGYNSTHYLVRNSWGPTWGRQGYHWMPKAYVHDLNLCDDFWALSFSKAST